MHSCASGELVRAVHAFRRTCPGTQLRARSSRASAASPRAARRCPEAYRTPRASFQIFQITSLASGAAHAAGRRKYRAPRVLKIRGFLAKPVDSAELPVGKRSRRGELDLHFGRSAVYRTKTTQRTSFHPKPIRRSVKGSCPNACRMSSCPKVCGDSYTLQHLRLNDDDDAAGPAAGTVVRMRSWMRAVVSMSWVPSIRISGSTIGT